MQTLDIATGEHNPNGHTRAEILSALRGVSGTRYIDFRYELLSDTLVKKADLEHIEACSITHNRFADIKRTAKFEMHDHGDINFLRDRIKPWVQLRLPPYGENDFVEWPQGVFLLSTPSRIADEHQAVHRSVEGYDGLQILAEDKVGVRSTLSSATKVTDRIKTLIEFVGITKHNITPSNKTAPVDKEWEPGTSRLAILNELCDIINYESPFFDEHGVCVVRPYVSPTKRPPSYTYADDRNGLIVPHVDQTLDLFSVPNKWIIIVSEPDRPMLRAVATNDDPASPTSTVSRGRTITDVRTQVDAVDQGVLDAKVERIKFRASQIYEVLEFETALWPPADGDDVYRIRHAPLAINHKYAEHEWSMELRAGATMKRKARRMVRV